MTFARARHIAFLVCVNNPLVLTGGVKFGQSEGIPDSGIPERFPLRKFHRRSLVLSPSLPSFFPALSLAFFFARAPLSERLEQAILNASVHNEKRRFLNNLLRSFATYPHNLSNVIAMVVELPWKYVLLVCVKLHY